MPTTELETAEFHWLMDMIQGVDVGLVVLDSEFRIQLWNGFMEHHSGMSPHKVRGRSMFDLFDGISRAWFERKTRPVFMLKTRAFTTWAQRPYLFKFANYRPITGSEAFMYQNVTIAPLMSPDGTVGHICLIVYDVTDVATNRRQLEAVNAELEDLSRTDRLTGLLNRGYWEECVVAEFRRGQRSGATSSLVMYDIDHFKAVNDDFGHQAGDAVLRAMAQVLRETVRASDVAGRYGGEEFGIVLADTDIDGALVFAERLRARVEETVTEHDETSVQVTVSLGVAVRDAAMTSHTEWIERADAALYRSKRGGRNRATAG